MKHFSVLLCLLLTACAVAVDQPMPVPAPAMDAGAAVQARNSLFVMNWKGRDAQKLVSSYHSEDVVLLAPNVPLMRGRDAVAAYMQAIFDTADATSMQLITESVAQEGNLAYEIGRYHFSFSPKGGGATVTDEGKYVVVWRRATDGQWWAAVDSFSSSRPRT